VTAHTDLAPTILKIAGGDYSRNDLDGSPIPLDAKSLIEQKESRQEHVNVEFWGRSLVEGQYKFSLDDGKFGEFYFLFKGSSFYSYLTAFKYLKLTSQVSYGANNTYKALRIIGKNYNLYYAVWCTNEHELYDLTVRIQAPLIQRDSYP
jgi:N-acetylglucosamine-6-sulfatase